MQRTIRLIPMDLPPGCSAAWFGETESDWIAYPRRRRMKVSAVAHAAAHLELLHCGRIRDGGRFACMDTHVMPRTTAYRIHMFLGQDHAELPGPLFTPDEEREADELASVLLAECGCQTNVPAQSRPVPPGTFRCVG